jgi:hypothetical protein
MTPPTPARPAGVAMSSTLVPLRTCSPRTLTTASVSPATSRAAICAIAPDYAAPITEWLSGSAAAWTEVLAARTSAERATIVSALCAYEAALEQRT